MKNNLSASLFSSVYFFSLKKLFDEEEQLLFEELLRQHG